MMKTFEPLTKKMTKKKREREGIERGIEEIDKKKVLKKSDLIPICF